MKYITEEDKSFFKGLKIYIMVILLLFSTSFILGIAYANYENKPYAPQASNNYSYNETDKHIMTLINDTYGKQDKRFEKIDDSTPSGMWARIFLVNTLVSANAISGIYFGILPVFATVYNGFFFGEFYYLFSFRFGLEFFLAYVLPHGIIELAGIFLSMSIGLFLGWKVVLIFKHMILNYRTYPTLKAAYSYIVNEIRNDFNRSIKFYVKYAIPLILVASLIEAYITPIIGHAITGL